MGLLMWGEKQSLYLTGTHHQRGSLGSFDLGPAVVNTSVNDEWICFKFVLFCCVWFLLSPCLLTRYVMVEVGLSDGLSQLSGG